MTTVFKQTLCWDGVDYTIPHIFTPETRVEKTICVFGDSFAEAAREATFFKTKKAWVDKTYFSWMWFLSNFLKAKIYAYGITAGSEQLTYRTYKESLVLERDATIIYHTTAARQDKYDSSLKELSYSQYEEWDRAIKEPCIHLYWGTSLYNFKSGITLPKTQFHLNYCTDYPTKDWRAWGREDSIDDSLRDTAINHTNIKGNLLLALALTSVFKQKFNWSTVI